jgi:hypothetical protein
MADAKVKADVKVLDSVEAKLLEIQGRLFVPKGQTNSFGNYNYRSCEDIEKVIKPLCMEYNCVLRFWDSIQEVGGRLFLKANLQLFDLDSRTNVMSFGWAEIGDGKKGMDPAQLTGACASYARKYALAGMFLIDNEKDPDATNKHGKDSKEEEVHDTISAQQINAINAELIRTGVSESKILDSVKKKGLHELTQADYVSLMKRLNATKSKED